jgi:hypothetical protein
MVFKQLYNLTACYLTMTVDHQAFSTEKELLSPLKYFNL